ncbi:MAG: YlxR family protein [Actinomycetota bacterium]|nr:YlxR family protein [Actinomycetota bacterium]
MGCNSEVAKDELVRLVRGGGRVCVDQTGKRAGRGAYLCARQSCLETALKRNRLARSLATKISEDDLTEIKSTFKSLLDEQRAS